MTYTLVFCATLTKRARLLTFHISDVRDACGRAFLKIFIIGIVGGKTKREGRRRGGEEEEVAAKIFNITM